MDKIIVYFTNGSNSPIDDLLIDDRDENEKKIEEVMNVIEKLRADYNRELSSLRNKYEGRIHSEIEKIRSII